MTSQINLESIFSRAAEIRSGSVVTGRASIGTLIASEPIDDFHGERVVEIPVCGTRRRVPEGRLSVENLLVSTVVNCCWGGDS